MRTALSRCLGKGQSSQISFAARGVRSGRRQADGRFDRSALYVFQLEVLTITNYGYLNRVVQPRLQTIDGVANAEILGGQTFAMRVCSIRTGCRARRDTV